MKSPPDRKQWLTRIIDRESVRYILAGAFNNAATYAAYLVLLPYTGYAIAYSLTYVAAIVLSYYLSARFVFRHPLRWQHAIQYPLVYVVQYLLGITLTTALIEGAQVNAKIAPALAIVIAVPFTFWLARWIIKPKQRSTRWQSLNSETRVNTSNASE
jgi:putative flippase GtrA